MSEGGQDWQGRSAVYRLLRRQIISGSTSRRQRIPLRSIHVGAKSCSEPPFVPRRHVSVRLACEGTGAECRFPWAFCCRILFLLSGVPGDLGRAPSWLCAAAACISAASSQSRSVLLLRAYERLCRGVRCHRRRRLHLSEPRPPRCSRAAVGPLVSLRCSVRRRPTSHFGLSKQL